MRMLDNLKIGTKVLNGYLLATVVAVLIGYIGYDGLGAMNKNFDEVAIVRLPSIVGLEIMNEAQTAVQRAERSILLVTEKAEIEREKGLAKSAFERAEQGWEIYEPLPQTKEEAVLWSQFVPAWNTWKEQSAKILSLAEAGQRDEALALSFGEGVKTFTVAEALLGKIIELNLKVADDAKVDVHAVERELVRNLVLVTVGGIVLLFALGIYIILLITRPINACVVAANKIAAGDTNVKLDISAKDETGILQQAMANMVLSIKAKAEAAQAIAKGDLSIEVIAASEADILAKSMQGVVATLRNLVAEAATLTKAAVEGRLATRGNADKYQGGYREIVAGINNTLDAIIGPLNVAGEYVDRISKGDIPPRITDLYNGDFNEIRTT